MVKKIISLLLAVLTIALIMAFLRLFIEVLPVKQTDSYRWGGVMFEFRWSVYAVLLFIFLPHLLLLISKRFRATGATIQGVIIGLISTTLLLVFTLIIFRALAPLPALLIITLSGFLFPLVAYIFELGLHSKKERGIKKLK